MESIKQMVERSLKEITEGSLTGAYETVHEIGNLIDSEFTCEFCAQRKSIVEE